MNFALIPLLLQAYGTVRTEFAKAQADGVVSVEEIVQMVVASSGDGVRIAEIASKKDLVNDAEFNGGVADLAKALIRIEGSINR